MGVTLTHLMYILYNMCITHMNSCELVVEMVRWTGGGVNQWSVSFSFSAWSLAIMNSYVMIVFFLFVFNCAAIHSTPSPEFHVRTHEGSKTIMQDGVKKKILVVRVFWSMVKGDYVYGKKCINGRRENGRY